MDWQIALAVLGGVACLNYLAYKKILGATFAHSRQQLSRNIAFTVTVATAEKKKIRQRFMRQFWETDEMPVQYVVLNRTVNEMSFIPQFGWQIANLGVDTSKIEKVICAMEGEDDDKDYTHLCVLSPIIKKPRFIDRTVSELEALGWTVSYRESKDEHKE